MTLPAPTSTTPSSTHPPATSAPHARSSASASTAASAPSPTSASTDDNDDTSRYKIRIETETTVSDPAALAEIFAQLGYHPVFVYEKYRTEWSILDPITNTTPHLVLDETPIGTYAELEGPTGWIDRTLATLNVDPAICLTDSYGKLFLDWKQRTGSPAGHLTFADIASPALTR